MVSDLCMEFLGSDACPRLLFQRPVRLRHLAAWGGGMMDRGPTTLRQPRTAAFWPHTMPQSNRASCTNPKCGHFLLLRHNPILSPGCVILGSASSVKRSMLKTDDITQMQVSRVHSRASELVYRIWLLLERLLHSGFMGGQEMGFRWARGFPHPPRLATGPTESTVLYVRSLFP
jgi:hypothetical protein